MRTLPVILVLAALGCGTGPKSDSFAGNWAATGGALNGALFDVAQSGDSLSGCFGGDVGNGAFLGTNSDGEVKLLITVTGPGTSYIMPLFVGHFVNASTVTGTVEDGSGNSVTMTRYGHAVLCSVPY